GILAWRAKLSAIAFHSFATCSGGNSICSVETESGCFSTSTFMKESDLTPRAFVGQPFPVAGLLDGRRHACPTIQITRRARTKHRAHTLCHPPAQSRGTCHLLTRQPNSHRHDLR